MDSNRVLTENVIKLMAARKDTQMSVAERGGISQRAVGYVVTYGKSHATSPTVRTVDGLAKAFNLPTWLLFMPDLPATLPMELLQSGRLDSLVQRFLKVSDEGRANIERIIEIELRFSSIATQKGQGKSVA